MSARCMISPVINPTPNSQTTKAEQYCNLGCENRYAIRAIDGRTVVTWALTIGRATDWIAAAADPEIEFLFTVPGTVNTKAELRAWLQSVTLADLTVAQRQNLQAIFDAHSINRADFTLATTGLQAAKRGGTGWGSALHCRQAQLASGECGWRNDVR
jgi:hypothetical protein